MLEHCPERWPKPDSRPRAWAAHFIGQTVILRHYAVLRDGEELTEYPKTVELDAAEWADAHAQYGLDIDGRAV